MAESSRLVFGNLAYDPFGAAAPELDGAAAPAIPRETPQPGPTAAPQEPVQAERPRETVSIRTAAEAAGAVAGKQRGVPVFLVLAIPTALLCLYLMLQSYSAMTAVSDEAARLEKQISQLEEARRRLEIEYESSFDMAEVDHYARTALGMVKADADQVSYIRNRSGDVARVLAQDRSGDPLLTGLQRLFAQLRAYLC